MIKSLNKYFVKFDGLIKRKPIHVGAAFLIIMFAFILSLIITSINNHTQVHALQVPNTIADNCSTDNTNSTDPTNDIETWLNSLPSGSTVDFPSNGCYLVQGTLSIKGSTNLTINGNGTSFIRTDQSIISNSNGQPVLLLVQNNNLVINNLNIDGGWDHNNYGGVAFEGHYGIEMLCNHNVVLNTLNVSNIQGDFIILQFNSAGGAAGTDKSLNTNVLVTNSNFNYAGYHGITFEAAYGVTFSNDKFIGAQVDAMDSEYDTYSTSFDASGNPYPAAEDNISIINDEWINDGYDWFASLQGQKPGVQEQNLIFAGNNIDSSSPLFQVSGTDETATPQRSWNDGFIFQNNKYTGSAVARATNGGSIAGNPKPVDRVSDLKNVNHVSIINNNIPVYDGTANYFHNTPYLAALIPANANNFTWMDNNYTGAYSLTMKAQGAAPLNECGNKYGADKVTGLSNNSDSPCSTPVCPAGQIGIYPSCTNTNPNSPLGVNASVINSNTSHLTWTASTDNGATIGGYYILRSTAGQLPELIGQTIGSSNSFTDNTLSPGYTYSYSVEGFDTATPANVSPPSANSSSDSVTTPASSTPPPSVPTNVTATIASPVEVDISWTASTDTGGPGLGGYNILRNNQVIASVSSTNTTFSDFTVLPGSSYRYTVQAYDTASPINMSQSSTETSSDDVLMPTFPTVPAKFTASNDSINSTNTIDLSWTGSTDTNGPGIGGYYIYNGTTNAKIATDNDPSCTSCSYTISGLNPNTPYSYYAEAFDTNTPKDVSFKTRTSSITTLSGISYPNPVEPTNLATTAVTDTNVRFTWTAGSDPGGPGIGGYNILNNGKIIDTVPGNTTLHYNDQKVQPLTTYNFTVETIDTNNPVDVSPQSSVLTVTTLASVVTPPSTPKIIAATAVGSSEIDVSWNQSFGNGTPVGGYEIFRNGTLIYTTAANVASFSDTGNLSDADTPLTPSTTYTYYVVAIDVLTPPIPSNNSASKSATTGPAVNPTPTTPVLQAQNISDSEIDLNWTASNDSGGPGINSYSIYRNNSFLDQVDSNTLTYQDLNVFPSTEYTYYVVANDKSNPVIPSANSNTIDITSMPVSQIPPPTDPSGLNVTNVTNTEIDLSWVGSTDPGGPGLGGYYILENGNIIDQVLASDPTTYNAINLSPNSSYIFSIQAFDLTTPNPLTSQQSNIINQTTQNTPAPSIPQGLSKTASTFNSITISWSASTDTGSGSVAGYAIYENGSSTALTTTTSTSYTVSGLTDNTAYNFTVAAYDNSPTHVYSGLSAGLAASTNKIGDIDSDGGVTGHDLSILLSNYSKHYQPAEFDGNTMVEGHDLSLLLVNYGH